MTPGHGLFPQISNSPFEVRLSSNKISSGYSVDVELKSKMSDEFEGFFVQGRDSKDNVIGTFETLGEDGRYVSCDNKVQSAVTHTIGSFKTSVKVKWNAPSDFQGMVRILATFVTDYSTYWVKVPSSELEVVKVMKDLNTGTSQNSLVVPTTPETEVLNENVGWSEETSTQPPGEVPSSDLEIVEKMETDTIQNVPNSEQPESEAMWVLMRGMVVRNPNTA